MSQNNVKENINPNNLIRLLKIMKLSLVIFFTCTFTAIAGNSYSQETMISLEMKNTSIKNIFKEIEKTSEYIFVFNNDVKKEVEKKASIAITHKPVNEILDELFAGGGAFI